MKKKVYGILFLAAMAACSKNNDSNPSTSNPSGNNTSTVKCQPIQISLSTDFDLASNVPWTNTISYTGNDISSITRNSDNVKTTYSYLNGRISKYTRFFTSATLADTFFYDVSGNIAKEETFYNGTLTDIDSFTYTGSQRTAAYHRSAGSSALSKKLYSYSNGLVSKVERYDVNGNMYDSYTYTYGTSLNKLYNDDKQIDIYFHNDEDMESVIYDGILNNGMMINNITYTETGKPGVTYAITADTNTNGYPLSIKYNGKQIIGFDYNCK